MKQFIIDTASWPTGARLALFFYLPGILIVQVIGILAEIPLYLEYRLTTLLRTRHRIPAPDLLGSVAAGIASFRPAIRTATWTIVLLAVAVVTLSAMATHDHHSQFLHSAENVINRWWHVVTTHAGVNK
jgi:hypothetical protein